MNVSEEPSPVTLRGVTWGHTRGLLPLIAGSMALSDRTAGRLSIDWEVRSLWDFGEGDLRPVADTYDLMVIDHPLVADAVDAGLLVPVDSADDNELRRDAVGRSQHSYEYGGKAWALAVDAACQVAVWRPDLLDRAGQSVPVTFDDVLRLPASAPVAIPMAPVDLLCTFFSLCATLGETPLASPAAVVSDEVGQAALDRLSQLVAKSGTAWLGMNPIDIHRVATSTDRVAYVPFAFGYSNYSRPGFARQQVHAGPTPAIDGLSRGALGGAGIAISALRPHASRAVEAARWLTSKECQAGPYLEAGGQPARRSAWDEATSRNIGPSFFDTTSGAIETAFPRPAERGMRAFQTAAGELLLKSLKDSTTLPPSLLPRLHALWDPVATPA